MRLGSQQNVAYFDQMRDQIDLNATLEDFISPGSEWIEIGKKRTHVKSYLSDFLLSPARANAPVANQLYASAPQQATQLATRLAEVEAQWLEAMERWEVLGGG